MTAAHAAPQASLCDTAYFNHYWHAIVAGSRLQQEEERHAFIDAYTGGRCNSLAAFLGRATTAQAYALVQATRVLLAAEETAGQPGMKPRGLPAKTTQPDVAATAPAMEAAPHHIGQTGAASPDPAASVSAAALPQHLRMLLHEVERRGYPSGKFLDSPYALASSNAVLLARGWPSLLHSLRALTAKQAAAIVVAIADGSFPWIDEPGAHL